MSFEIIDNKSSEIPTIYEALQSISDCGSLCVACPYINLEYLEEFTTNADSWKLVTDFKECLSPKSSQNDMVNFIDRNTESIRDCRSLHAKAVIGKSSAYLGSANLTGNGLRRNKEIGVYINEEDSINALDHWFDKLWRDSVEPDVEEIREYNLRTPEIEDIGVKSVHETKLVAALKYASGENQIKAYFEKVSEIINSTGLTEYDRRISATAPSKGEIAINVNSRYVLKSYLRDETTGIMIKGDSAAIEKFPQYISDWGQFSIQSYPRPKTDPYWFNIPNSELDRVFEEVRKDWIEAVRNEAKRASASNQRSSHNPAICRAALDEEYRKKSYKN